MWTLIWFVPFKWEALVLYDVAIQYLYNDGDDGDVPIKWEALVLYDVAIQYLYNDGDDGDDNFDTFLRFSYVDNILSLDSVVIYNTESAAKSCSR